MMEKGIYFIVIALFVAELFKVLIYANQITCDVTQWTQNDVKQQEMEHLSKIFLYRTETFQSSYIRTKYHDMAHCDISMAMQWAVVALYPKGKIRVSLPNKGYLLLMFIQWV